jgi:hypothetical protein
MVYQAKQTQHDVLYLMETGLFNEKLLENNNCIITKEKNYFSLYNNTLKLHKQDIYVPFL